MIVNSGFYCAYGYVTVIWWSKLWLTVSYLGEFSLWLGVPDYL